MGDQGEVTSEALSEELIFEPGEGEVGNKGATKMPMAIPIFLWTSAGPNLMG